MADPRVLGVVLAGGQGPLTGQIFRVGHLGSVTLGEILDAIGVLEQVSIRFERQVQPGAGIAAAQAARITRTPERRSCRHA